MDKRLLWSSHETLTQPLPCSCMWFREPTLSVGSSRRHLCKCWKGPRTKCVWNMELSDTWNEMKMKKRVSIARSSAGGGAYPKLFWVTRTTFRLFTFAEVNLGTSMLAKTLTKGNTQVVINKKWEHTMCFVYEQTCHRACLKIIISMGFFSA